MSMRWGKTIPLYKICQVAEALPLQKVLLKIQRHRHGFLLMWLAFFLLFFCSQLLQPEVLGLAMDMKLAAAEIPATPCHVRQMLQHLEDKKQTKKKLSPAPPTEQLRYYPKPMISLETSCPQSSQKAKNDLIPGAWISIKKILCL